MHIELCCSYIYILSTTKCFRGQMYCQAIEHLILSQTNVSDVFVFVLYTFLVWHIFKHSNHRLMLTAWVSVTSLLRVQSVSSTTGYSSGANVNSRDMWIKILILGSTLHCQSLHFRLTSITAAAHLHKQIIFFYF